MKQRHEYVREKNADSYALQLKGSQFEQMGIEILVFMLVDIFLRLQEEGRRPLHVLLKQPWVKAKLWQRPARIHLSLLLFELATAIRGLNKANFVRKIINVVSVGQRWCDFPFPQHQVLIGIVVEFPIINLLLLLFTR